MGERSGRRPLLLAAAVVLLLTSGGCKGYDPYPSPPAAPLRPDFAAVIDRVEDSSDGWLLTMADGRTIDQPQHRADTQVLGAIPEKNNLAIARTGPPRFFEILRPIEQQPGCWEAWPNQGNWRIAWDEGDAILFSYGGIELPKAADYHSDVPTTDVAGRKAWTSEGQSVQPFTACANSSGQIEWVKLTNELTR